MLLIPKSILQRALEKEALYATKKIAPDSSPQFQLGQVDASAPNNSTNDLPPSAANLAQSHQRYIDNNEKQNLSGANQTLQKIKALPRTKLTK